MIPIFWRYTLSAYIKIFLVSVGTFISVLLVSRFKEIARFAALSSDWGKTGLYAVYQIPFILPMAIPLSAFIASILLFQLLSRTHEITAFRSLGLSLKNILTPILLFSLLLSIANFSITAELSPFCKRESKRFLYEDTSSNPLLLLQRQSLIKLRNAYMRIKTSDQGTRAKNFVFITFNESTDRLNLMSAMSLSVKGENLTGENVAIISPLHSNEDHFDPLIIENQGTLTTATPLLTKAIKKNRPRIDSPSLSFRMLRHRLQEKRPLMASALVEILRRLSVSISVFSFTFLGAVFAIQEGRSPKKRDLCYALLFAFAILSSYFLGKSFKKDPFLASIVFPLPHVVAWIASTIRLRRLSKGVV